MRAFAETWSLSEFRENFSLLLSHVDVDLDDVVHLSICLIGKFENPRPVIIELLIFTNVAQGWLRADRKSH